MFIFFFFLFLTYPTDAYSAQVNNIFILAGQSNMSGRGGVTNVTWDGVVPPECQPNPTIQRLNVGLTWEEAHDPLHQDIDSYAVCGVGPGMAFANSLLGDNPSFGVIGLVPCAIGGTKISQWSKGTFLYNQTVSRTTAALQGGGTLRGMLWYQGESDTVEINDVNMYKSRLEKFFLDLRADLNAPKLPIIQVGIASAPGKYMEEIRKAQFGVELEDVRIVDAKGLKLGSDYIHLTTPAEVELGKLLAKSFLDSGF